MAKGSVRKKGKKWYYRFYIENESGKLVQKEYVGTEKKSETEKLLRKAMEDYEKKKFVAKGENITLGDMLDIWLEEEVKPGTLSTGTLISYTSAARQIKKHPIGQRKLKNITADHLQEYIDLLSFGGIKPDGTKALPVSKSYMLQFSAILHGAFRFAVFPKRYITFNPMQYVRMRVKKEDAELFKGTMENEADTQIITHEQYKQITEYFRRKKNPALLPVQIAYYTGLRIGEVCGLTWQDINLEEQYLIVRRSMRYNVTRHKTEIGATKRKKIRTVDFCDTLAEILKKAKKQQQTERFQCSGTYFRNYYRKTVEKGRIHYDLYSLQNTEKIPEDYEELFLVCLRHDGSYEATTTLSNICQLIRKNLEGLENFHFHQLRHTYTSNLLSSGADPKEVQELLGHSDVNTTMNVYAHATREAKRTSARLLDKVADN